MKTIYAPDEVAQHLTLEHVPSGRVAVRYVEAEPMERALGVAKTALEFYGKEYNYNRFVISGDRPAVGVLIDRGKTAQAALQEIETITKGDGNEN